MPPLCHVGQVGGRDLQQGGHHIVELTFRSKAGFGVGSWASGAVRNGGAEPPCAAGRRWLFSQGSYMEQGPGLNVVWQLCWPQNLGGGWMGEPRVLSLCHKKFFALTKKLVGPSAPLTAPLRPAGGSWAERESCWERHRYEISFLYLLFLVDFKNGKAPRLGEAVPIPSCFQLHFWPRAAQGCEGDVKPLSSLPCSPLSSSFKTGPHRSRLSAFIHPEIQTAHLD